MEPPTLQPIYRMFDQMSDGVCLADDHGAVLYMNPAASALLEVKDRSGRLENACDLLCGKLSLPAGGTADHICPLREKNATKAVAFEGRHGPHSVFNWRGDQVKRSDLWKDLRVRCLRTFLPIAGKDSEEVHVVLIEDASAQTELRRHRADWRNMIAHDLRAPLTSIFASLMLLEELHPTRGPGDQDAKMVALSLQGCRKMMELLDLYLDVAKLDAEAMPVKITDVELSELVAGVLTGQAALAQARGLTLRSVVPAGLKVRADAELLERALGNLVNNAIKYNKPHGSVTLSARLEGPRVLLGVADTGLGIASTDLPFIFDRYYQAEARRAGRIQGNGLGLTFCKEALGLMEAEIEVHSKIGEGSEFTIALKPTGAPS